MYESYWGLKEKPFDDGAPSGFIFRSQGYEAALAKLLYLVEGGGDCALVTAPAGCGKTLLAGSIRAELSARGHTVAYVAAPFNDEAGLLSGLLSAMGDDSTSRVPDGELPERLQKALADEAASAAAAGHKVVMIVDEAQALRSPQVMERLRMVLGLETEAGGGGGAGGGILLMLLARPEFAEVVDAAAEFAERISVRARIDPMADDESRSYMLHRLEAAGSTRGIFTEAAADLIARSCGGSARRINALCGMCLAMGYSMGVERVGPDVVGEVIADLEV